MQRLNLATLCLLPGNFRQPLVARANLRPRIVHLGLGAFFRAHGAMFTEDCTIRDHDWGIVGASLKRPDTRNVLQPQDFLYTARAASPEQQPPRVVGNLLDILVAPEDPLALVSRMADVQTEIVTLTVTEKGYGHDPATGELNFNHPDIAHDLREAARPRSAIGFLVAALAARRRQGLAPFTVISCDNLPGNGPLLKRLVTTLAEEQDAGLARWIRDEVAFPASMVDRIVPAEAKDDAAQVSAMMGLTDAAPVTHEPFRQWVLQDHFTGARPRWETAGVQLVSDVEPFERAKLRMLNGAHSALAYLGYMAGHETMSRVTHDPVFVHFVRQLWGQDIAPSLQPPPGLDLADYAKTLLTRFQNPAIHHRTWQIAMDGSQKLPQRLLGTVRDQLRRGGSITHLAFAVAGWLRYVEGIDENGAAIDVRDPLLPQIRQALRAAGSDSSDRVRAALGLSAIFGEDLRLSPPFVDAVAQAYGSLQQHGTRAALAQLVQG